MTQCNINILDYILQRSGARPQKQGNKVLLNPCPVCGHRDHFFVYPGSNSYYSFSGCCKGGSLVEFLVEHDKLPLKEALRRVRGDLKESVADKAKRQETQRLARLLTQKVEAFFSACIERFKLFSELETDMKAMEIDRSEPAYRYIRQAVRFYDRITSEFINGDFSKRVQLMQNHKSEYFFKLKVGVSVE